MGAQWEPTPRMRGSKLVGKEAKEEEVEAMGPEQDEQGCSLP